MPQKVLLPIGMGNVGSAAVVKAVEELDMKVEHIVKSTGVYDYQSGQLLGDIDHYKKEWKKQKPDIVFMTIPSYEDGKVAFDFMDFFTGIGVPVVTAEKGALANYFEELSNKSDLIGRSATVGGGTRMIGVLKDRVSPTITQIHLVVNGTLNFIMDGVSNGRTLGQVVDEAIKLGYAEPGASNPLDVINGEAVGDIPKKTSILWNSSGISDEPLDWKTVKQPALSQGDLQDLLSDAKVRRFIVSLYRTSGSEHISDNIIASFKQQVDGWTIVGGFQNVNHNPLFDHLIMPGPANGMVVAAGNNEEDGVYQLTGPGAGPHPTAASMILDARHLLGIED
jgi:homoserine dehydrogenase